MRIEFFSDLGRIAADEWDALVGEDDPFVEHAFLHALAESGSVGAGTGWEPLHLTLWDDAGLAAAIPLYLKEHGFGEYIFGRGRTRAIASTRPTTRSSCRACPSRRPPAGAFCGART
ncbi:MAG: hypothetical protein GXP55_23135 [Deltaproteobacteria bacterium]|nr:hypothetical protein [Deltaproteobacteria bacterium]